MTVIDGLQHALRRANCGLFSVECYTIMLVSILIRYVCRLVKTSNIQTGAYQGLQFWRVLYRNFHLRFLPRFPSMVLDESKDGILEKSKPSMVQAIHNQSILLSFLSPVFLVADVSNG